MDPTTNLSPIRGGNADFISANYHEPTLQELLADPLTGALMKADHVDGEAFAQMLHTVTGRLRAGTSAAQPMMAFDEGAAFLVNPADLTRLWRASVDLSLQSAAARFMHGGAPRAAERVCGSYCTW